MNSFRADLHCHTTCSDGSLSPTEIIHLAKQIGLSALSITDHDSIEAYKTAIPLCSKLGIQLLIGAEFSTVLNGTSIHVLGYGFQLEHPSILLLCAKHTERRHNRNLAILELLAKYNMPISEEELKAACMSTPQENIRHCIGRPHIALAMVHKGYVETVQDAFNKFLGEGKTCYAQGIAFSVEETIEIIHQAKGLAVIAHPHLLKNSRITQKLLDMNFDGIECYYGKFPPQNHTRWLRIAKKKEWLITGGSDFHGAIKPFIPLGCSWIGEEQFQAIQNRLQALV